MMHKYSKSKVGIDLAKAKAESENCYYGTSVFDGHAYAGTAEELDRIGCVAFPCLAIKLKDEEENR